MKQEIERKFLVDEDKWNKLEKPVGKELSQGYLASGTTTTIRVRTKGDKGFLTIKGKTVGASRPEYEYEIPRAEANELLENFAITSISKIRFEIEYAEKLWEVDVFKGDNEGLIVAEIELESEDEPFEKPDWITEEVTDDKRYYNSILAKTPFKIWESK